MKRDRLARVAAGALATVVVLGGSSLLASSGGSPTASSFVPTTPCRLFDTRTGSFNVGDRATPLGPGETLTVPVWGSNGNCSVPAATTGVSLSVAIVEPSAASYLTVFPADAERPVASNLNWVAGQAPTPNAVTAALSSDGKLSFYNLAGTVNLLVDVVGYYELAAAGTQGPPGPQGAAGPQGPPGPKGEQGAPGAAATPTTWTAAGDGAVSRSTPAASLIALCTNPAYSVQVTAPADGAQVWVHRNNEPPDYQIVLSGSPLAVANAHTADAHITIEAVSLAGSTRWEIWASTEGGCRLMVTETLRAVG